MQEGRLLQGAGALAAAFLLIATASPVANAQSVQAGEKVFQQKCAACHSVGGGKLIGPDLKGVTSSRPYDWLARWIGAPDSVLAHKDPYATSLLQQYQGVQMPNLQLSRADVNDVLAFLEAATNGTVSVAAPAAAPSLTGDAEVGRELFTGARRFQNGGSSCMACHSVAGLGALGGGQLGPDLTTVVSRYGGVAAVDAFVRGTPTPTMSAVWRRTPLTDQERANVVAFLAQATMNQRPAQLIWKLLLLAVLGLAVLLGLASVVWRRRLAGGVRRPMIARLQVHR